MAAAHQVGWEPVGIELTDEAAAVARRWSAFPVFAGDLTQGQLFEPGSFDVVTLWGVVEHVPDPEALLVACRKLLKPNGRILMESPNPRGAFRKVARGLMTLTNFRVRRPLLETMGAGHVVWYADRSYRAAARRLGLRLVDIRGSRNSTRFINTRWNQLPLVKRLVFQTGTAILNQSARTLRLPNQLMVAYQRDDQVPALRVPQPVAAGQGVRKSREVAFYADHYQADTWSRHEKFYSIARRRAAFYDDFVARHTPGRRVLDYGCGQGKNAVQLAQLGAHVVAVDISPTGIDQGREAARELGLDIDFRIMDAERLDFEDQSFDLVCGIGVLHHLELRNAFAEVARVLKPDGTAIFMEPLGHNPLINLYRRLTPDLRTPDEHPLKMRDFDLATDYFTRGDVHVFDLLSLGAAPFSRLFLFSHLLSFLETIDRIIFRRVPLVRRYAWYAAAIFSGPTLQRIRATGVPKPPRVDEVKP